MNPIQNPPENVVAPAQPVSVMNIPVNISREELNATLNFLVNELFNEGFTLEDGVIIHTYISGLIDMQAVNNQLHTTIPLKIELTPPGIFKNLKVDGIISVQFITSLDIFQDELLNKTELHSHRWISKPVVNLMGLNLPIEPIANLIIKKYKTSICTSIDESIRQNFKLNKVKAAAIKYFAAPLYSTDDSIIHLYANPLEFCLGPIQMTERELQLPLIFYFESALMETRPTDLAGEPSFSIRPYFEKSSSFNIQSRIPLPYVEQMVREQITNQKYGSGVSSITVHKISLLGNERQLGINLEVTGAYNGLMKITFEPVYDESSQKIELENFSMKTEGGGKLRNLIFNLMKGFAENKLQNVIEEQINANLQEYLTHIHKMLAGSELLPGVYIHGDLLHYQIKDIRFYNSRMYFTLSSVLNLFASVRQIDKNKLILKRT